MVDQVHWLLTQCGAAEEWQIEVAVGCRVVSVWYPSNFFRLSFGKHDKLDEAGQMRGVKKE